MLLKKGIKTRVVRLLCVSPIPVAELKQELNGVRKAIVLEETTSASGIGQVLSGVLDGISVDPILPKGIDEYSFPLVYKDTRLRITVTGKGVDVVRECGEAVYIKICGNEQKI